jgi:hypothetical protein
VIRWVVLPAALVLLGLLVLVLDLSPAVEPSPAPSVADVTSAREVYTRVRAAQQAGSLQPLQVTGEELRTVVRLAGRAAGILRADARLGSAAAEVSASLPLPLGLWLNGTLEGRTARDGSLELRGRVGRLPVPRPVVHALFDATRWLLRGRGADVPPLASLVPHVRFSPSALAAVVSLPTGTRAVGALNRLRDEPIDPVRVERAYCALVERDADLGPPGATGELSALLRSAFAAADGSVADNRARFVALALVVAGRDVGALASVVRELSLRCGDTTREYRLQGRADLAKHWTVSAALTSAFGTQASLSIGTWKEISDSGVGGSGFSLVDLAADRSGTFCAQHGAEPDSAAALRAWLAVATPEDLLPVGALALAEGMTEAQFRERYTDTDSATFESTVRRIDAQLAVLLRF